MSIDKRITDIAAKAALAAGKNASVAPQLLLADIAFVLDDAVKSGELQFPAQAAITAHESVLVEENERLREALRDLLTAVEAASSVKRGDFYHERKAARAALEQGK